MTTHYFYNIMRKIIVQSLDIFNNITIAKYDNSGEINEYVKVPLQFAPKTKQWYFQQSKRNSDGLTIQDNIYPVMAVSLTGMEFARDRMVNNLQKVIINHNNNNIIKEHLTPIPYDYLFTLEVVSEHMIDLIQIIEQILPWFNPHIMLRISVPEMEIKQHIDKNDMNDHGSESLEIRVTYNGASVEAPTDIDIANVRLLKWNFDFTAKGFLFQPIKAEPIITKIINNFYGSTPLSGSINDPLFSKVLSVSGDRKYDEDVKILYNMETIE